MLWILIALTLAMAHQSSLVSAVKSCNPRQVADDANKIVCICSKQLCTDLEFEWPKSTGQAHLVQTTREGLRFDVSDLVRVDVRSEDDKMASTSILVNLNTEYQPMLGWGGAITDAAGINLASLSDEVANKLVESYYGTNGLQYNFGRVPIGGSDFSPRSYSYDDSGTPDYNLTKWSLAKEDIKFKIPFIKKVKEIGKKSGVDIKLFASPWSPPKWMKTSNSFVRGTLIDDDKIYKSYVNYLMKFYDAYEEDGIKFWGATVQNEPIASFLPTYFFSSLQFGNDQMIKFISKYLGPALWQRGWTKDNFKLMVGDDSLGFINYQVPALMRVKEVQKYVSGLAFHWYTSGVAVPYDALTKVYNSIKDNIEFVLMTEACAGSQPLDKKVDLGSWDRGESYVADIIEDLVRQTAGWIDWNLALDMKGGPNWARNFVDSPILVDSGADEFYKQPMYYALAHFSRFFKPGSIRVATEVKDSKLSLLSQNVMSVAVHNKETGHLIINILNKSDDKRKVVVTIDGRRTPNRETLLKTFVVEGKSINSVVMKL